MFSNLNSIHTVEAAVTESAKDAELPALGEYHVVSLEPACVVAVSTLASADLSERLSSLAPQGLSIVGKTETENIGIEKIILNTLAVPAIRHLILCGRESEGHLAGQTLEALVQHGVGAGMRVRGSRGRKPVLANLSKDQVEAFRGQVQILNRIGCEDATVILSDIAALAASTDSNEARASKDRPEPMVTAQTLSAPLTKVEVVPSGFKDPTQVKLDPKGYFVIVPKSETGEIYVEHYSNQDQLLHVFKGKGARDLYWAILDLGLVSELSHAAYLGKELMAAELSMSQGFKYVQDKA